MRFWITGISGFVGTHLTERLLAEGHEVTGFALEGATPRLEELAAAHPRALAKEEIVAGDIRDPAVIEHALERARPDGVFHLAGIAFVPRASANPRLAYEINLLGTVHVLDAVRRVAPKARVVVVTSSEVYGRVADPTIALDESLPFRPVSPYGVSKAAADLAALQASLAHGLDVIRARPFNHTGPGQERVFVCSEFAAAIAEAEAAPGVAPARLRVGNLAAERDFSDVRDVVRGYLALFERGQGGEAYNVGSGRATRVGAILDHLRRQSRVAIDVEVDPAKLRPGEVPRLVGATARIEHETGWRPEIPLERSLDDLLAWWRQRAVAGARN